MSGHTPGPWSVGYRGLDIVCVNEKIGGSAKLFDVRGWGYLTGHGHGALGLDAVTAEKIQMANAALAAAAPELLEALKRILDANQGKDFRDAHQAARAAIAKSEGRT